MSEFKYRSPEWYEEQFSDIFADIGDTPREGEDDVAEAILEGLRRSLDSWVGYHQQAADRFRTFTTKLSGY